VGFGLIDNCPPGVSIGYFISGNFVQTYHLIAFNLVAYLAICKSHKALLLQDVKTPAKWLVTKSELELQV
jgi:hypothetical protein